MRINIVVDSQESWFNEWTEPLMAKIRLLGHECFFFRDPARIPVNSDVTFFLSCERYVSPETRAKSTHSIVIHASDLPKGRGMSPATWQILEGKRKIPVTLFEMAEAFDAGDYYLKDSFILNGTELIDEWREESVRCIERMALTFIKNVGRLKPKKQRGKGTIYPRRRPEDSELDTGKTLREQFNLLRVADNERYPVFFRHKNQTYILKIFKRP